MSDAIFATIRDGCVALDEPTDWPQRPARRREQIAAILRAHALT